MDFSTLAQFESGVASRGVVAAIASNDVMFNSGKDWYFRTGASALRCVLSALANSRLQSVRSVLDMPCGHGRVSRFLRAAFPDASMTFCDIDRSGVDFCSQNFSGTGVYSQPELTNVKFTEKYDIIWVGSLFTHVDEFRTARWLDYLFSQLNQNGILVASFHGAWSIEMQKTYYPMIGPEAFAGIIVDYERTGWGFACYDGSEDYGISLSTSAKVMKMAGAISGSRILSYVERGWADNHDILTIAKSDRLGEWQSTGENWLVIPSEAPKL